MDESRIEYLKCSNCGKKVSTTFTPHDVFILRAKIECPECMEKEPDTRAETPKEIEKELFEIVHSRTKAAAYDKAADR